MNWELILQTVVPLGAFMAWLYSRLDKRFDKFDQRFDSIERKIDNLSTRVSRIEGALWGMEQRKDGTDQK